MAENRCQFLSGRQIKLCGATENTLVLLVEELETKCETPEAWKECKFYKERMQGGVALKVKRCPHCGHIG